MEGSGEREGETERERMEGRKRRNKDSEIKTTNLGLLQRTLFFLQKNFVFS